MVVWLVLVGLLGGLIILGWWGAMTTTTALTLAMTNAVQQTMMTILACTLLAMMPLLLLGAFKLGEVTCLLRQLGEQRKYAARDATRVSAPPIEVRMPHQGISPERVDVPAFPRSELPALPSDVSVIRAPHSRVQSSRVRAMRIAQRWFR